MLKACREPDGRGRNIMVTIIIFMIALMLQCVEVLMGVS